VSRPHALVVYRPAPLATIVLLGVLTTVLLPLSLPADGGPTGFDRAIGGRVHSAVDAHRWAYRSLVAPSDAYVVIAVLLAGVLWYLWRRDWWRAGFLFVAPGLAVAINTYALKYVWHRHLHHYLAYPSGHTVQCVAVAAGFVLLAPTVRVRTVAIVVAAVLLVAVAVGMVGLGYHYPTDVVGGTATAIALVTAMYAVCSRTIRTGRTAPVCRSRTTPATPPR
jgi:undecaprenyl-diphosphatase